MPPFLFALIAALVGVGAGVLFERWLNSFPEGEYIAERPIPARGKVVPAVAALLLGYVGWYFADRPLAILFASFYTLIFLFIFVTDYETRWIFTIFSYPAVVVALIASPFDPRLDGWKLALLGGVIGLVFFGVAWFAARSAFGQGAFGRGDVVLGVFMGLTSAFPVIIMSIVLGVLANGLIAITVMIVKRGRGAYMPYGPMLCVAGWITMVWGEIIVKAWLGTP